MEAVSSNSAYRDDESRDLDVLLEAFGIAFSLKDIAHAYCQANRNVDMAGEILYKQGYASKNVSKDGIEVKSASSSEFSFEREAASSTSSELSFENLIQKSNHEMRISRESKPKRCPASMGTVSGIIGKDYVRPRPPKEKSCETTKPVKLDSKELLSSEIWSEEIAPTMAAGNDAMHKDIEEFLYKMLGDGLKLDMNEIRDVLGICGHDIEKSMENLLELSVSTLEKSDDILALAAQETIGKCPDQESLLCQENLKITDSFQSDGFGLMTRNEIHSPKRERNVYKAQKEILEVLFNAPERSEEKPRTLPRVVRRSRTFSKVVTEPLRDSATEHKTTSSTQISGDDNEDDECSYEVLRKAVKEHWITMKEYYKSAVEAFSEGDYNRADKLLMKGHFFNQKAREADEKSVQKIFDTGVTYEDWSLDLHNYEPKEVLRLLRRHLVSLPGLLSYRYLKVKVGTSGEDPKGRRKRRITEDLKKESIKWTEEENGSLILIRLDEINPKRLSYSKDYLEKRVQLI